MSREAGRPRGANIFVRFRMRSQRTGWSGRWYGLLERIGPVTRASPIRRGIQVLCLLLFLYAFFYVCWPYAETFSAATFRDKEFLPVELFLLIDPLAGLSTVLAGRFVNATTLWWAAVILAACLLVPRGFCGYLCPLGTLIDGFDWLVGRRKVGGTLRVPAAHTERLWPFRFLIAWLSRAVWIFQWLSPRKARLWRAMLRRTTASDRAGDAPLAGSARSWWVHLKYYLLAAVLISSLWGVLLAGFVSAIPVLTRGLMFTVARLQLAILKGPGHLAPVGWTFYLSIGLFLAVFLLSLFGRRFWCRHVCPSGALFSVSSYLLRIGQRRVAETCIACRRCREVCPFDAIREDYTTRPADCTFCQTCGGVCPPGAIQFGTRLTGGNRPAEPVSPVLEVERSRNRPISGGSGVTAASQNGQESGGFCYTQPQGPVSRRAFVVSAAAAAGAAALIRCPAVSAGGELPKPLRPPGSVPEELFLDLCIRCGQCFKVCPGPVLQPAGPEHGWESLWTPVAFPAHAGCHQDCNFCTLVCPTGAIQPLDISVKRRVHMGLARVDTDRCLPFRKADRRECDVCYVECRQAGYDAIQMREIEIPLDPPPPEGMFSELELLAMTRIRAPFVDPAICVGCGICEYRCHTLYVVQRRILDHSAIRMFAENEHRLTSYPADPDALPGLRPQEEESHAEAQRRTHGPGYSFGDRVTAGPPARC